MDSIVFNGIEYRVLFPNLMRPLTPEEDADLGEAIKREGRVVKPVVTDGNGGLIDGFNRLRWAQKLSLPANKVPLSPDGRGLNADQQRQLAIDLNDTGRQDTYEIRQRNRLERIGRVADARQAGESIRTIATKEGVSKSQVERDLNTAESQSTVPGGGQLNDPPKTPVKPKGGKITGKDGRTRTASPKRATPPKPCDRCSRIGAPSCAKCKEKFPTGFPREPGDDTAVEELTDAEGTVVPEHARPAFLAVGTLEGVGRECDALRRSIEEVIKGPAGRLLQTSLPGIQQKFKDIKGSLMANRPSHVCPYCDGKKAKKPCECCKGEGWVAKHIFNAAPKGVPA